MHEKKRIRNVLALTIFGLLSIAAVNYYIDPYWTWKHSNNFNNKQMDFDERQQKTNYLYFIDNGYDELLLGSSKTTYIDQNQFQGRVFNYAANGMVPYEYRYFIDTFTFLTHAQPKKIILGADFFGANTMQNKVLKPMQYLTYTTENLYREKLLFNYDILKSSVRNVINNVKLKPHYSRNNIKSLRPMKDEKTLDNQIEKTLPLTNEPFEYDNNLVAYYIELKKAYPDSQFIIFTTPATTRYLAKLRDNKRLDDYRRWLWDLVTVFGEVHHFMIVDSYTSNKHNFFDAGHFRPELGNAIAKKIEGNPLPMGIILNRDNFDQNMRVVLKDINDL